MAEPDLIVVGDYVRVFFDNALWVEGTVVYKPINVNDRYWVIQSVAAVHYIGINTYSRISKETPTPA